MPSIESFMDEVVADYRRRLALLPDGGDRRAVEDGIALLTDHRLGGMDASCLEKLLSTLASGRSPVGLAVLKPEAIARDLGRRWQTYMRAAAAPALPEEPTGAWIVDAVASPVAMARERGGAWG